MEVKFPNEGDEDRQAHDKLLQAELREKSSKSLLKNGRTLPVDSKVERVSEDILPLWPWENQIIHRYKRSAFLDL